MKSELDAMTAVEASDWFERTRRQDRSEVIRCAVAFYEAAAGDGGGATEERDQLFDAVATLVIGGDAQADYFARRKAEVRADNLKKNRNIESNLEEGRRLHQAAVRKARAEGKITDAVRKERAEERRKGVEAAHFNPDPSPEPIIETWDERIVNDELRSFGSIIKVETGNIEYRLGDKKGSERG